ncbi:hypothetical protein Mal64_05940 [Pseudobythopirellula maris]|uniref:Gylcosyl hydrolase 115 C-terminal domain-containing protein n=1 Tax=Pseudobythopirellula maris TaxID=2527991 RepID=A0A5C5ZSH5_9BACT|nr:glycosyl hydrolase 115 family protein [Pseudobythopirellula maris]TWT90210.1 hypothetical protein Mal64_05940 [Pseudobythopirellula maris]
MPILRTGCRFLFLILFVASGSHAHGQELPRITEGGDGFAVIASGQPAAVWVDPAAPVGVQRVAEWFADDLERLTGVRPSVTSGEQPPAEPCVLVGVLGSGGVIDRVVESKKIDTSEVKGKREASLTQSVEQPAEGLDNALVIAGSDKRGAIYGLLDLSRAMGVSPWYWWADAPVERRENAYCAPQAHVRPEPKVRYRGIFINDEAPALSNWASDNFGGFNKDFYANVYELILRNRGNFLWPAMWGNALFDDDPDSQQLADELGVVLSTSHHEPMMRAHAEWSRYGEGSWNFERNPEKLKEFWSEGIRRMGDRESVVTLGMRGDGDKPMTQSANIDLLQRIVAAQREIIAEERGEDHTKTPQVWALYKEVQEYFDRGMRVPDDVILLLCDDNWGNVRRLPRPDEPRHPGGYGMYYHFDYVGDPRNYKWTNTNSLPRVWEQMNLCWRHEVDQIWVVNVGDIKPMEEPIDFFLTLAYDPDRFPAESIGERLDAWRVGWAREQFGPEKAEEVASLLRRYAKYVARRTPEQLDANVYSLTNYDEWPRVVNEWRDLMRDAERIEKAIPDRSQSAYYQLVLHPILAVGNLHELYFAVAENHALADQGDPAANKRADDAERLFARDQELTRRYHELEGGKWNHIMRQVHIGYTSWRDPREQVMPEVRRVAADAASGQTPSAAQDAKDDHLPPNARGFVEQNGYVSIEAPSFSRATEADGVRWRVVADLGRVGSSVISTPVAAAASAVGEGPCLEYPIFLTSSGPVSVEAHLSPTLDFYGNDEHGIRFGVSIDDAEPVVVDMHADRSTNHSNPNPWRRRVSAAIHVAATPSIDATAGAHTLRFWRIDPGVVLQKLVVKTGEVAPSYLGPPESPRAD